MAVRLGELLLREKRVTPTQLQEALTFQRANGGRLGTTLVKLGFLKDEDPVQVAEAFDITAVAQSASTLMDRLSATVSQLNSAVLRLDRTLLAEQSLSNLTLTVSNLKSVSDHAVDTMATIKEFLNTNTVSLSRSVTNFQAFTEKLNNVTVELHETVATNRVELTAAMKNIGRASERADRILQQVDEGKGLVGTLLRNEQMAEYTALTLSNLAVFSSNRGCLVLGSRYINKTSRKIESGVMPIRG